MVAAEQRHWTNAERIAVFLVARRAANLKRLRVPRGRHSAAIGLDFHRLRALGKQPQRHLSCGDVSLGLLHLHRTRLLSANISKTNILRTRQVHRQRRRHTLIQQRAALVDLLFSTQSGMLTESHGSIQ